MDGNTRDMIWYDMIWCMHWIELNWIPSSSMTIPSRLWVHHQASKQASRLVSLSKSKHPITSTRFPSISPPASSTHSLARSPGYSALVQLHACFAPVLVVPCSYKQPFASRSCRRDHILIFCCCDPSTFPCFFYIFIYTFQKPPQSTVIFQGTFSAFRTSTFCVIVACSKQCLEVMRDTIIV